jgi:hypothetical protein
VFDHTADYAGDVHIAYDFDNGELVIIVRSLYRQKRGGR